MADNTYRVSYRTRNIVYSHTKLPQSKSNLRERFLAMSGQQGWQVFGWADVLAGRRWSGWAFCGAGDLVWWADERAGRREGWRACCWTGGLGGGWCG